MRRCKAAVVGAGASGLMAGLWAARGLGRPGAVLLLEGNPKPGKKLLATGNGRCNLTNLDISPTHYHGDPVPAALLERYSGAWALGEFRRIGLLTREGTEGRMYPNSLQAGSVVHALLAACGQAGAEVAGGFEAVEIAPVRGGYLLTSRDGREVFAQRVVLACGGKAGPKHSCGEGYALAKALGHSVTALSPSLAGLRVKEKLPRSLKGTRCKVRAALMQKGREVCGESGEVIFGDGVVSGICVMNLSARVRDLPPQSASLCLDLLEGVGVGELTSYLREQQAAYPDRPAGELLAGAINQRLGWELVKAAGVAPERAAASISAKEMQGIICKVKALGLQIAGVDDWAGAQATAGGVPLSEVDLDTMESRLAPGIYLTGELLNVDGDCGGYNLHWAWLTGALAGQAAGNH